MPGPPKNIDDYLTRVTPVQRAGLQKLRRQILALLPGAEECISYSMPAFREPGGHVVAGFLATKHGCSYFPFSGTTLDTIAGELLSYSRTKSGLHFDPAKGLPQALLRKLIATRRAEIAVKPPTKRATTKKRATEKDGAKKKASSSRGLGRAPSRPRAAR